MIYLVCVMCGMQSIICAGFSLCHVRDSVCVIHVQDIVCVMCGIEFVLCAGFSLSYVKSLVCVM